MAKAEGTKRLHSATYAKDKKSGGYLVRVMGPHAGEFAGREVPVGRMGTNEETMEKLVSLVWLGTDTGFQDRPGTGQPVALYKFEAKPRVKVDHEF